MQNKGAVRLFAILMALACLFYLSFSLITRGVEADAKETADKYVARVDIKDSVAKYAKAGKNDIKFYTDSFHNARETRCLDSMRRVVVWDLWIAKFTYEDCKEKEINLGLDLRGGMNVTLEVSVRKIIEGMSNKPDDAKLKEALDNTIVRTRTDNRDFTVIFGEEMKKVDPQHPLSFYFRNINNKEITSQSTDDEVLGVLRRTINQAVNTAKETLEARINRFGVAQPNIQKLDASGRILIELPGISDKKRVRNLLQGTANLEFWETWEVTEVLQYYGEANDRLSRVLDPKFYKEDSLKNIPKDTSKVTAKRDSLTKDSLDKLAAKNKPAPKVLTKRDSDSLALIAKNMESLGTTPIDTNGVDSLEIQRKKFPLFLVLRPNQDPQTGKPIFNKCVFGYAALKDTALINKYLSYPEVKKVFPENVKLLWAHKSPKNAPDILELYSIKVTSKDGKAALYGDIITSASKTTDQRQGGNFSIEMDMNTDAADKWRTITKDAAPQGGKEGRCIAIVLDDLVYSAPTVQNEISGGRSQITGDFTAREADDLANILSAGKLPAPSHIVEEQVVGPTLGAESIRDGLLSFVIAFIVVLLFMAFYYNKAGWVANLALLCNLFFIMGVLASLGAVLTLPGITGIVLTIGLSVDANILIYERVREELRRGKGLTLAISEGFKHAMSSILDSNITLLLLGIILFAYGTGPVQGFATTLIIGILCSLFCAIFITRLVFDRMLKKERNITFGNKMTENAFKNTNINFVARRKLYYLISAAVIVLGVAFYFKNDGFKLGVDFKGGFSFVVKFDNPQATEPVIGALTKTFGERPEVKTYGTDNSLKITTTYLIEDIGQDVNERVETKLNEGLKTLGNTYSIESQSKVGPGISRDTRNASVLTVLFSCVVMFFYILIRFKKWQYGFGAVVALFHDVLIVLSFYTIFDGILPFSLEIDQHFIAAILTVMGYTMTESVIVFDRIREFLAEKGKSDMEGEEKRSLINYALNSTLSRTINTSLTILFVLIVIFIFGGDVIRGFIFALLIGRVIGTYSSLCISTPIVIDLDRKKKEEMKTVRA